VYEEPRLREQDFGNFQPSSQEMTRMWQERADYGHFFYRIPNGESAADAYDRVSGFNESLWRSFGEEDFASVCVLVTHGLMTRVFLMKWYHFSVEYFEDLRNINHCEFIVMKRDDGDGKFVLQNKLRTWTEYQAEKEAEERGKRGLSGGGGRMLHEAASAIPVRKYWGGCLGGDDVRRWPRRQNTADMFQDDGLESMEKLAQAMSKKEGQVRHTDTYPPADEKQSKDEGRTAGDSEALDMNGGDKSLAYNEAAAKHRLAILQAGRDGGGSMSGHVSRSGSDYEEDEEVEAEKAREVVRKKKHTRKHRTTKYRLSGASDGNGGVRQGTLADALGDQSDLDEIDQEVRIQKAQDQSFEGSVR
jgi:hypothetical protein